MHCVHCGAELKGLDKYCRKCGERCVNLESAVAPEPSLSEAPVSPLPPETQPPPRRLGLPFAFVGLAVVVAGVVGYFIIGSPKGGVSEQTQNAKPSTALPAETTPAIASANQVASPLAVVPTSATIVPMVDSSAAAQPSHGKWIAFSSTAAAITGDIVLAEDSLTVAHLNSSLPLSLVRTLAPNGELAEALTLLSMDRAQARGSLYRLTIPNKALGCGDDGAITWIVAVESQDSSQKPWLGIAMLSGVQEPQIDNAALDKSNNLCGTFSYTRE